MNQYFKFDEKEGYDVPKNGNWSVTPSDHPLVKSITDADEYFKGIDGVSIDKAGWNEQHLPCALVTFWVNDKRKANGMNFHEEYLRPTASYKHIIKSIKEHRFYPKAKKFKRVEN